MQYIIQYTIQYTMQYIMQYTIQVYLADFKRMRICHLLEVSATTVDVSRQNREVWTWSFNAKCITSGDGIDFLSLYNCYVWAG